MHLMNKGNKVIDHTMTFSIPRLLVFIILVNSVQCYLEDCFVDRTDIFKNEDQKYLFYDVNPAEGFNLRRDVFMRFALMLFEGHCRCGLLSKWKLVLPPWHKMFHWKENQNARPSYWGDFFDVDSIKSFAPVAEMYEAFDNVITEYLEIDTAFVLQNYEEPFDEHGVFRDKWEFNLNLDECQNIKTNFWGFKNITIKKVHCIKFQGKINKLMDLFSIYRTDKMILVINGEIPLHEHYGSKMYWDFRRTIKFSKKLVIAAKEYISEQLACVEEQCSNYLSVHWRRGDFAHSRKKLVPSINGTVQQIDKTIKKKLPEIKKIFISTDAAFKEYLLLEKRLKSLGYEVFRFLPKVSDIGKYKEGGIAIIDQIICSRATYFIGTHESTFSFRIQEEREILGYDSNTTFNRLCPDKGICEKPSVWKILPP